MCVLFKVAISEAGNAVNAGTGRVALGSTTVGDALFITASDGAERTTLGAGSTGDAVFTTTDGMLHTGQLTGLGLGAVAMQREATA